MHQRVKLIATGATVVVVASAFLVSAAALPARAGRASVSARVSRALAALRTADDLTVNWAGYVDTPPTGGAVTSVHGAWIVPNAGTLPPGFSGTWTGIGGSGTSDLIQAGTFQTSSPLDSLLGVPAYGAFYETLPNNAVSLSGCSGDAACTVQPGDPMAVDIALVGPNQWTIDINDTGRWSFTTTVSYQSSESSAEWIYESPLVDGVMLPVGGSGVVTFDGNRFGLNGSAPTTTIGSGNAASDIALPVETATSALDADGDGFNVCTYNVSCSPPAS
jgi:hypothetical protein